MGIYTSNRYLNSAHDWASEIPANEAYDAAFGCAHILADCQANDMALFESTIYSDISEVKSIQEGYGYVNENAFTDVINKIVEMFKKLLAKIKGIFAAFITKLSSAFKDGKTLVNKYSKQIIKYSNWKGFKCKDIRKPNGDGNIKAAIDTLFTRSNATDMPVNYAINTNGKNSNNNILVDTKLKTLKTDKQIDEADSEDIKNEILYNYIGIDDIKELHTEIMDHLFEDKDTIDGDDDNISGSYFSKSWIKTILEDTKWENDVKKFNKKLEKNINTIIDNLDRDDDELAKFMTKNSGAAIKVGKPKAISYSSTTDDGKVKKTDKYDFEKNTYKSDYIEKHKNVTDHVFTTEELQKAIHVLQKLAGNEQEVITKITSEYLDIVKFTYAQAKKLWVAAAAWSSGVHKESVEYTNAMADVVVEQFYTNMESI